mmetsp:Transcript_33102/g.87891  ORF Transcript_33102/g.87891 Transcript_33102/m.87891 type:complete len:125 (+) Transcript_33102:109-483(+)
MDCPRTRSAADVPSDVLRRARRSACRKKALSACLRCKTKRLKCSGFRPCSRCHVAGVGEECLFPDSGANPIRVKIENDCINRPQSVFENIFNETTSMFQTTIQVGIAVLFPSFATLVTNFISRS